MFRKKEEIEGLKAESGSQVERITSVLGDGVIYTGKLSGRGGVRLQKRFRCERRPAH